MILSSYFSVNISNEYPNIKQNARATVSDHPLDEDFEIINESYEGSAIYQSIHQLKSEIKERCCFSKNKNYTLVISKLLEKLDKLDMCARSIYKNREEICSTFYPLLPKGPCSSPIEEIAENAMQVQLLEIKQALENIKENWYGIRKELPIKISSLWRQLDKFKALNETYKNFSEDLDKYSHRNVEENVEEFEIIDWKNESATVTGEDSADSTSMYFSAFARLKKSILDNIV